MAAIQPLLLSIYKFLVTSLPSDFFKNTFVTYMLDFFQWLGCAIFAFSFLLMISSAVESKAAGEYVDVKTTTLNIFKGLLLLFFSRPLVIWSFDFARTIASSLVSFVTKSMTFPQDSLPSPSNNVVLTDIQFILGLAGKAFDPISEFVTLIMFVVTIVVFFQLLTLYGMYFVQIITGYFYITDVMRGNLNAAEDWVRDIVASGTTFMLEYIFYVVGVALMDSSNYTDLAKGAPGLIFIIASPAIPTALRKWGYNHGSGNARGVVAGLGNAVAGTASALTHI